MGRHDALPIYADRAMRPGGQIFTTDVCVPISRLAECIVATEKDVAASFLPALLDGKTRRSSDLRRQGDAPRRANFHNRCMCADFAAGRMYCRDRERCCSLVLASTD